MIQSDVMGDRWSYPHQASAATYVWMPLQVDGTQYFHSEYWQCWISTRLKPVDALRKGKQIPVSKNGIYTGLEARQRAVAIECEGQCSEYSF